MCYKHKESVKDDVVYQNNKIVEMKQRDDRKGIDNDGYIIAKRKSSGDSEPIYDTVIDK